MKNELTNALEKSEELYLGYLSASGVGVFNSDVRMDLEPVRDSLYPVDFVLDDRKVHALVG